MMKIIPKQCIVFAIILFAYHNAFGALVTTNKDGGKIIIATGLTCDDNDETLVFTTKNNRTVDTAGCSHTIVDRLGKKYIIKWNDTEQEIAYDTTLFSYELTPMIFQSWTTVHEYGGGIMVTNTVCQDKRSYLTFVTNAKKELMNYGCAYLDFRNNIVNIIKFKFLHEQVFTKLPSYTWKSEFIELKL